MNCSKCNRETEHITEKGHDTLYFCNYCQRTWTEWQQAENETLLKIHADQVEYIERLQAGNEQLKSRLDATLEVCREVLDYHERGRNWAGIADKARKVIEL